MKAKLADGTVLNFPDGTDPAVIQQTVKRVIAQKSGNESDLTGGLRTFANAALMGGGSEVAGGVSALYGAVRQAMEGNFGAIPETMSQMYKQGENLARTRENQFAAANPKTALGLNIGGALTTAAPLAAFGMARVAGAGLLRTLLASGGIGAVEGGMAGALSAPPGERAGGAAIGGGIGLAGGALFPVIGAVFGPSVRRSYEAVAAKFGQSSKQAQDYLARAMNEAGISADDLVAKMRSIGPEAAPVDVARSIEGLGEAAVQRPGVAREIGLDFAEGRSGGMLNRVKGLFDDAVGPKGKQVMVRVEDSPEFAKTLDTAVPISETFMRVLKRDSMKNAWKEAQKLAGELDETGYVIPDLDAFLAKVNSGEIRGVATRMLHYLKKGLDDVIEPGRDPVTGSTIPKYGKNMARALEKTRRAFRSDVKKLNPEYGKSLDRMAAEFQVDDAYSLGKDVFKPSHNAKAALKKFGSDERRLNAYRQGAADKAMSLVEGAGELGNDVAAPLIRKAAVLRDVFGDGADSLIDGLKAQRAMKQVENRMVSGSQTGYRKEIQKAIDGGVSAGEMALDAGLTAASGIPAPGMLARGARAARGFVSGKPGGRALDELGEKVLFNQNPQQVAEYMKRVAEAQARMTRMRGARGSLMGLLSQAPSMPSRLQTDLQRRNR